MIVPAYLRYIKPLSGFVSNQSIFFDYHAKKNAYVSEMKFSEKFIEYYFGRNRPRSSENPDPPSYKNLFYDFHVIDTYRLEVAEQFDQPLFKVRLFFWGIKVLQIAINKISVQVEFLLGKYHLKIAKDHSAHFRMKDSHASQFLHTGILTMDTVFGYV